MTKTSIFTFILLILFACTFDVQGQGFVKVKEGKFSIEDQPYYYIGANFWIGMNLGMPGPNGNRARLLRELDHLQALGINNLRIMAGTEGPDGSQWRINPALQTAPETYNELLFNGLDFLLLEMGKRNMKAVVCLNNYWYWSGGMAQYVSWNEEGKSSIPYPEGSHFWQDYERYVERFYVNDAAMKQFESFISKVITRVNIYTQKPYYEDPVIMSWELANEPRGSFNQKEFQLWIEKTSGLIRSLDANHLIVLGSEGDAGVTGTNYLKDHSYKNIDYGTLHIWIENRGWFNPEKNETFEEALKKSLATLDKHIKMTEKLNKPLVLEEFGVGRLGGSHNPKDKTTYRDKMYANMFEQVLNSSTEGGLLAGANFWAWSGEGRPREPKGIWYPGDEWIGDPPHENQGWYSVYDTDISTLELIAKYAHALSDVKEK